MEMLKFLTQKLKAQSLNEVSPFQPCTEEDHDSGTESDEENAELQALEEAAARRLSPAAGSPQPLGPRHARRPPPAAPAALEARRPFQPVTININPPVAAGELERHSSEEELAELCGAKRKWSISLGTDSGSSDEEVKLAFVALPAAPASSAAPASAAPASAAVAPCGLHRLSEAGGGVSPRKRHCHSRQHRPCLDFDKMQGSGVHLEQRTSGSVFRRYSGGGRARLVKIKSVSSRREPSLYDPSVFAFRSISTSYGALTPVEEPHAPCAI